MELNRIKILADKYFDGTTSREEEVELREALKHIDNLDSDLKALATMLGAMEKMTEVKSPIKPIQPKKSSLSIWLGRAAGVAVAACAIFGIILSLNQHEESILESQPTIICHVNGELIADQTQARAEAERVLGGAANNMAIAMASIDKIKIRQSE